MASSEVARLSSGVASSPKRISRDGRCVSVSIEGDRAAENGEVDRFVRIGVVRERRQPSEMSPSREPDHADPRRAAVAQPANLSPQRVQWRGMSHHQRVAEHAGRDAQLSEPSGDRFGFMGRMFCVTPAR
jgi:hypothetical protein